MLSAWAKSFFPKILSLKLSLGSFCLYIGSLTMDVQKEGIS
jgi:hypothetical protein